MAPPCEGAFDLPSFFVAAQGASILRRGFLAIFSMRTNQLNPPSRPSSPQRVRIGGLVVDQAGRIFPRPAPSGARHRNLLQGRLDQSDFRRGRRVQVVSQRKTLAVCHHHPLRTFAPAGQADTTAPFWAGAKLPSANVSAQSSWPCPSSWPNNVRHAFSQMSWTSQRRSRRQHVLGEGYRSGRSFQRTPLRNTYKDGWQSVWDPLWGRRSVRVTAAQYEPIGRQSIQRHSETWHWFNKYQP